MIYKRGKFYWYKFMWNGALVRESTKQGNDKVARQMESAHRTSLAKGEVGLREKKPSPRIEAFIKMRVDPWAQARFKKNSPRTYTQWYRPGFRAICAQKKFAALQLDEITSEHIAQFAAQRQIQGKGLQISTVNSTLRVLRRVLGLAAEWGELAGVPKVNLLRGERHRDRVVSPTEEKLYLAVAPEPLASIVSVMFDTGLRPDECFSLRWEYTSFVSEESGLLQVANGKTVAARRLIPMTPRVRLILWNRWLAANKPETGYLWPAATRSGHVDDETIRRLHLKALAESKVRAFVLHSVRHSFLTRLGEAGVDAWTLARIAGHSSIKVSARYVHPSEDSVLSAIDRLGGHKNGHTDDRLLPEATEKSATASAR